VPSDWFVNPFKSFIHRINKYVKPLAGFGQYLVQRASRPRSMRAAPDSFLFGRRVGFRYVYDILTSAANFSFGFLL